VTATAMDRDHDALDAGETRSRLRVAVETGAERVARRALHALVVLFAANDPSTPTADAIFVGARRRRNW
jgi:hypothetical protein